MSEPGIGAGSVSGKLNYVILVALVTLTLFPLVGILLASFSGSGTPSGFTWPKHFTFDNYVNAWRQADFSLFMRSSVIVSVAVVVITVALSILAGYAFGTMRFPGRQILFYLFLLGIVVPTAVLLIPIYFSLRGRNLIDTYFSVVAPEVGLYLAFGTFWMRSFFLSAPRELIESARLDGANSFMILVRVLLPLARPAVTTLATLVFLFSWNEFLLPLVMTSSVHRRTAPLGIAFLQGEYFTDLSLLSAAGVIVALPVILVFVVLQRHFVRGVLTGAVKG